MNAKVLDKWTKALRNGSYRQGEGALRQRSRLPIGIATYDPLGVLADLYRVEHQSAGWVINQSMAYYDFFVFDRFGDVREKSSLILTNSVRKWAELEEPSPNIPCKVVTKFVDLKKMQRETLLRWQPKYSLVSLGDFGIKFIVLEKILMEYFG